MAKQRLVSKDFTHASHVAKRRQCAASLSEDANPRPNEAHDRLGAHVSLRKKYDTMFVSTIMVVSCRLQISAPTLQSFVEPIPITRIPAPLQKRHILHGIR